MKPVTEYEDYRMYMQDYYNERKRVSSFSWREYTRASGFTSPTYLKLVCEGKTLYLRRSNLQHGQSLCPLDYVSSKMTMRELRNLVYSVFRTSEITIPTARCELDLVELLEGLQSRNLVCRFGKRLKLVPRKAGQLLFRGLYNAGLSWNELEGLFVDENIAKNANPKKVAKLLETDTPSVRYYRNLFGF